MFANDSICLQKIHHGHNSPSVYIYMYIHVTRKFWITIYKHYWSQKLLKFPKRHCVWLTYTVQTLYHTVQDTDIYCTVLYITVRFYWIVLYSTERYCTFLLTCTVQYWTTLYVLTDLYCTALNHTVQDTDMHCTLLNSTERVYWHILYTTVQHWTGIQTHTVHYCTVIITLWFKFVLFFLFFFLIKSI